MHFIMNLHLISIIRDISGGRMGAGILSEGHITCGG